MRFTYIFLAHTLIYIFSRQLFTMKNSCGKRLNNANKQGGREEEDEASGDTLGVAVVTAIRER